MPTQTQTPSKNADFHSGFVSIIGRPNAGKSTLLNTLVGNHVAIVADKPQTTRVNVQGIWNGDDIQVVFLDTPGIHKADSLYNKRMMQEVRAALSERDLLLYVADATRPFTTEDDQQSISSGNREHLRFSYLTRSTVCRINPNFWH